MTDQRPAARTVTRWAGQSRRREAGAGRSAAASQTTETTETTETTRDDELERRQDSAASGQIPDAASELSAACSDEESAGRNPWERFGWLMRGVWLVFLIYPLLSVFQSGRGPLVELLGVLLVAAFIVVYLGGMDRLDKREARGMPPGRLPAILMLALCVIPVAAGSIIGLDALGFTPFILSFTMFALPVRWAFATAAIGVATVIVLPWALGQFDDWWSFGLIVFSVVVATGVVRIAVEQGHRYERVRDRLAVVAERERVARDVHDVLGHSLTVVTLKAELAERLVDDDPTRAKAELAEIQTLTRQALAEIRETVGGLRAARLDDEVVSARRALTAAGIRSKMPDTPEGLSVVDPRHRIVLAWVLREAVTNVVRHSDANVCTVELSTNGLTVVDDGKGLGMRPEGNGIRGLRERVEAAGGTLTVETGRENHGTVLEVTL